MTIKSNLALWLILLIAVFNIALLFFIAAPQGHYSFSRVMNAVGFPVIDNHEDSSTTVPALNQQTAQQAAAADSSYYTLQWRHVKTENVDDYQVETYQEFQIYKDVRDRVVKIVSLPHYEYLRYWMGKNNVTIQFN